MKRKFSVIAVLLFVVLLQACATAMTPHEAELYNADNLFKAGKYEHAIAAYKTLLQKYPDSEIAADAQFAIAYTLVYYDNPNINYAQAMGEFKRFMTIYPNDSRYQDAQNWYRVLKVLNDTKSENAVLFNKIQQLKQLDIQRERSLH
ncbi:MAG: tetratricopeptide repeat protein [Deltaproteobacteria bacterium]|nr:tetratricopeptide repeat protein [Deltaproteobacteria bacterium]